MRKADNLNHPVPLSRNLGALNSWSPLGLSRPVTGLIFKCGPSSCGPYLYFNEIYVLVSFNIHIPHAT